MTEKYFHEDVSINTTYSKSKLLPYYRANLYTEDPFTRLASVRLLYAENKPPYSKNHLHVITKAIINDIGPIDYVLFFDTDNALRFFRVLSIGVGSKSIHYKCTIDELDPPDFLYGLRFQEFDDKVARRLLLKLKIEG